MMRAALLGAIVLGGLVTAGPAAAYPSRQPCTMHFATTSIDHPIPTGTTGDRVVSIDMVGSVACNAQPAQSTTMTLRLTVTGCATGKGVGIIDLPVDGWRYQTALVDFEWALGEASFNVQSPIGPGVVTATPLTDVLRGYCFTGLTLDGGFVYNIFAGTTAGG